MPSLLGEYIPKNTERVASWKIDNSHKAYLNYDELNNNDSINRTSSSDWPVNSSNSNTPQSAKTAINSEENMHLSASSAYRNRGVNIKRVNNAEKPIETGNAWIKPPNHKDDGETIPPTQNSTVSVRRVNKSAKLNETNDKSQTIDQEKLTTSSAVTSKTGRVNVIKIRRKRPDMIPKERSSSICSISVINLEKSSQPMNNRLATTSLAKDRTNQAGSGVTVVKLPRTSTANHSHNS